MQLASRLAVVGSALVVGLFLISCGDAASHARPLPTQPQESKGVTTNSVPKPTDDCSLDPSGYGCGTYTYDPTSGCPSGCATNPLTASQKNGISGALRHIDMGDPECVALADYATHVMNIDHIRWYTDPFAGATTPWGDIHFNNMGSYNDDPWIHIADMTLNNSGGSLTLTLMHEAVHGYYGVDDSSGIPEATAQRCYRA